MASKTDSTKVMWRVQVRKSRAHKWRNAGLFETRERARQEVRYARDCPVSGVGFGNTRVVRHVRGGGR